MSDDTQNQYEIMQELTEWFQAKEQLAALKRKEADLRQKIFNTCFPTPVEGARNKFGLPEGYTLKATHVVNRSIDEAAFQAIREPYFAKFGQPADRMVKTKLELRAGEYKAQTEEEKKLFDQALVVKPGTPQLEIVAPKEK